MNIDSISMSFGTQVIFNNASVILGNNDKVGVVGPNGAGKSTLFKLILNELDLTGGSINLNNKNIGYLPQVITDEIPSSDITVFEYLLEGRPIDKLQKELTSLYNDISIEKDNNKLNRLMKRIDKLINFKSNNSLSIFIPLIIFNNILSASY